jgi:hypothetical protein
MDRHDFPTLEQGAELLPFEEPEVMQFSMAQKLAFDTDYYRTMASGGRKNE